MPKPVERRCGTCRFLDIPPDSAGRRRALKNHAYDCFFEPPKPTLPASIWTALTFKMRVDAGQVLWPRFRMFPVSGRDCPTWEVRK